MLLKIKAFAKGSLFKYIGANFISVIVGFIISSYILVKLGPKDLGIFTLFMLLVGLFSSISQGAANSYLMKNFFLQDRNQTITSVNITMLFFSILAFWIYYILSIVGYSSYFLVDYFIIFAILKALNSTAFVVMRLYEDANLFLIYSITSKSLYALVVLFFIYDNMFNIKVLIDILFVNEILFFVLLYGLLCLKYGYRFSLNASYIKDNIALSLKLFPHKVFKTIYENIDKYAIQFFIGYEALGIYSMLIRIVSPIAIYIKAVNNEFAVIMSKVFSKKAELEQLRTIERQILILLVVVNVVTILFATMYNNIVYDLGNNFYPLLALVVIFNNNMFFYYAFYNILFLNDKKIIYYIMGLNLILFGIGITVYHNTVIDIAFLATIISILDSIIFFFLIEKFFLAYTKQYYAVFVLVSLFIIAGIINALY